MFEVTNDTLMSPDTQKSMRMLYERNFEPSVAKKAQKLLIEYDKNFTKLSTDFKGKDKDYIKKVLEEKSKFECEKLVEQEVLYNHPISAQFINGIADFIN